MTNGDPVVVRAAMKPLPTLTKPLRSVDLATHEPAAALRERTDSCTVPAAGVVGEAMVALVLAAAYREKLGGDHIDDTERRCAPTRSASGGAARSHRAARSSWSGSWARASRPAPVRWRRSWAARPSTPTASWSSASASRSSRSSTARARRRSGARGGGRLRAARPRRRAGDRARRRGRAVGAGARGADPPHGRAPGDRARGRLAARSGKGRPLARDPGRFEALWRDRRALYESVADVVVPPSDRDALRRALPFVRALAEAPSGHAAGLGGGGVGRLPGLPRPRADRVGLLPAAERPALRRHRRERGARSSAVEGDERIVVMPGEEHKTIHGAEHVLRSLAQGGRRAGRPGRGGRRRRRRRPGRLLRRRLPARDAPRSGADHAGGAGRLRLRRQDRRRPARGQELRRARTTSPRPCCATRPRSTRCPPRRRRPATRRSSRRR